MHFKEGTYHAVELEDAWRDDDAEVCYRLLASIPYGVNFRTGNLLLVMFPAIDEEKDLMHRSIKKKREFGLIMTAEKKIIVEGSQGTIDLDDIAGALYKVAQSEKPVIFSHTHWDPKKHPLPGFADIGFGDIALFDMFIGLYPLVECRVAFNSGNEVKVIVYKGKIER